MTERRSGTDPPCLIHPEWAEDFPGILHGITLRGEGNSWDLALFGQDRGGDELFERWWRLRRSLGGRTIVLGRQLHGSGVAMHRAGGEGLRLVPDVDGHLSAERGLVLCVTVADCVPVYLVDPEMPAVALLHAGWRGTARGILERGIEALEHRLGASPSDLHLHLGPAICGRCYEVGPEVHRALGLEEPGGPEPVDLRAHLGRRAVELGLPESAITTSSLCTRCGDAALFSHRGGDGGRQVAFLGIGARAR